MGTQARTLLAPTTALAALVLVLAALVSARYDGVSLPAAERGTSEPGSSVEDDTRAPAGEEEGDDVRPPTPPLPDGEGSPWVLPLVLLLLAVAVGALVVVLVVAAGLRIAKRRRQLTGRRAPRPGSRAVPGEEPEDEPEELAEVIRSGLQAVEEGPPRNAIVAAWMRLEAAATSDRLVPHPSDTPSEFVGRVLSAYGLEETAIRRLADLYVEARFSRHRLTEAQRDEARACLERLLAGLTEVRR